MMQADSSSTNIWTLQWIRLHPLRFVGILTHLLLRTLFGVFWLAAAYRAVNCGRLEPARFLRSPLARRVGFDQKLRWVAHAVKRSMGFGSRIAESQHG